MPSVQNTALWTLSISLSALVLVGCGTFEPDQQTVQALCAKPESELQGQSQRALLGAGYKALETSRYDCAERLLLQAQTLDPKDPYAPLNLGVVYQRTNRITQARQAYEQALRLDPAEASSQAETVVVATDKQVVERRMRPGQIARHNLTLLP